MPLLYVIGMAEVNMVIDDAKVKDWWTIMRVNGIKYGDLLIMDPFSDTAWIDKTPGLKSMAPHMSTPWAPSLSFNKKLRENVESVKTFVKLCSIPVLINILGPNPRYLTHECYSMCMPQWNKNTLPGLYLQELVGLDKAGSPVQRTQNGKISHSTGAGQPCL